MAKKKKSFGKFGKQSGNLFQQIALGTGAVAALGLLGSLFYFSATSSEARAVDAVTLCPKATGPVSMTAILLDLTDPLSPAQHGQLVAWLEREIADASQGTQFTLGIVSEFREEWGASAPLCKPQKDGSQLTENLRLIETRYQEHFYTPLLATIEGMLEATGANRSPIMESLSALVSTSPGFVTFQGPKKLIIVSDLLEHSDVATFYGPNPTSWDAFRSSPQFGRMSANLVGADVTIYQLPRAGDGARAPAVVEDFWLSYFDHQGARLPRVRLVGDL